MKKPYRDTITMYKMMATPKENVLIRAYIEDLEKKAQNRQDLVAGIFTQADKVSVYAPEVSKSLYMLTGMTEVQAKDAVRHALGEDFLLFFKGDEVKLLRNAPRESDEVLYEAGMTLYIEEELLIGDHLSTTYWVTITCTDGNTSYPFFIRDLKVK